MRRRWLRYLRSTFGFDITRGRFLRRSPDILIADWTRLLVGFREYLGYHLLVVGMILAGTAARRRGDDPDMAGVVAFFEIEREYPWLVGIEMSMLLSAPARDEALLQLSAWAATKISTRRNRRLRAALGGGSPHEVYHALLERLPAAVLEAWYDLGPGEHPRLVRSQAADLLAGGGQRRRKRRLARLAGGPAASIPTSNEDLRGRHLREHGSGCLTDVRIEAGAAFARREPSDGPRALDDFTLRETVPTQAMLDVFEMADAARSIARRAELSPLEEDVYVLDAQGLKHKEMAERLSRAVGTTKGALHRAKAKIRERLSA